MAHKYFTTDISQHSATIQGADAQHLVRVLRTKQGDVLTLCDGKGHDYDAQVQDIQPQCVSFAILEKRKSDAEPSVAAHVFIGMTKSERMEYAVQKSVELGAASITAFYSEHSVVKPKNDEQKTARLQRIANEAAKQCGRGVLPAVHPPLNFAQMLAQAAHSTALFFYEVGGIPLRTAVQGLAKDAHIALITGAEGGFSPKEAQLAQEKGFHIVGLGARILRCETAPVAALAAVMTLSGNLE